MKCLYCSSTLSPMDLFEDFYICPQNSPSREDSHTIVIIENNQIISVSSSINHPKYSHLQVFLDKDTNVFHIYYLGIDDVLSNTLFKSSFQPLASLEEVPILVQRYLNLIPFS